MNEDDYDERIGKGRLSSARGLVIRHVGGSVVGMAGSLIVNLTFRPKSIISIKNLYFITYGPHNQYVLIDMSLTFIFRQGLPGKRLNKRPQIPPVPRALARGTGGLIIGNFIDFALEVPGKK